VENDALITVTLFDLIGNSSLLVKAPDSYVAALKAGVDANGVLSTETLMRETAILSKRVGIRHLYVDNRAYDGMVREFSIIRPHRGDGQTFRLYEHIYDREWGIRTKGESRTAEMLARRPHQTYLDPIRRPNPSSHPRLFPS
jgi:hypothetical protein